MVTSGYSAEAGRSGGGGMNVITKSGTNVLSGSGVLFLRDDQMAARLPRSPLDAARGVPADDPRYEVDEFRRYNWGASLGGPIRRDRTHFFFSYDQTAQRQPFLRNIRGRGQYDAVLGPSPSWWPATGRTTTEPPRPTPSAAAPRAGSSCGRPTT